MVAWMYAHGLGVSENFAESLKWNRAAAVRNYPQALNNLGYMYEHGLGVEQDSVRAAEFYRQAAKFGLPEGRRNLAIIDEQGGKFLE